MPSADDCRNACGTDFRHSARGMPSPAASAPLSFPAKHGIRTPCPRHTAFDGGGTSRYGWTLPLIDPETGPDRLTVWICCSILWPDWAEPPSA
ncbi:hypothetical protein [Acetobacter orleanensis]|uniref:hypothetical protein n=1 Tax=Acetobacter orleanensis TaxID=104099 RepID=UPI00114387E1|nr:hypothetical protein [Acetobacter orleanensis]